MIQSGRTFSHLCLLGVVVAALGLAACGRKGPLELPPSAAGEAVGPQLNVDPVDDNPPDALPTASNTMSGGRNALIRGTVQGPRKRIPLDVLLD